MAASLICLQTATAVLGYEYEGATSFLAKADPETTPIQFSFRIEGNHAFFDIVVPIKYKEKTTSRSIIIRISPPSITSVICDAKPDVPAAVKPVLPAAIRLEIRHTQGIIILIPSVIQEPITIARRRSGLILNSLYELSCATSLHIYIPKASLSLDQLSSLSTAVARERLQPFSGPEYDLSRMFSGSGAKATTLSAPLPSYNEVTPDTNIPLYNESSSFDPPDTRLLKRKYNQEEAAGLDAAWTKLTQLEVVINSWIDRDAKQSLLIQELRAEVTQLREQVSSHEKKHAELESEVTSLREAQDTADDNDAELAEIRDDIKTMEGKVDFIERGKDEEQFVARIKEEVLEELAPLVKEQVFDDIVSRFQGG